MPPKSKKDVASVPIEDFSQDVLLVATVQNVQLKLGLQATAELLAPQPLGDATAAPTLHVELLHNNAAPIASTPAVPTAESVLPVNLEHKFRQRKVADIVGRLINSSFEARVCNSQTRAILASTTVDLLPFGLGKNEIQHSALPLQPADTADSFKILQGSTLDLCIRLMHQPTPTAAAPVVSNSPTPSSSTSGAASSRLPSAQAASKADAAAAPTGPILEPYFPVAAEDAASCNVLEFVPLPASVLPPQLQVAAKNAAGALSFSLALHIPSSSSSNSSKAVQAVVCEGGCLGEEQVAWNKRRRAFLNPAAVQALKALIEKDQPLLLEVARYLMGTAVDTFVDPAFSNYHALLQLECVIEQLQEPGSLGAVGCATAAACMSWALQQGNVQAACLPLYTQPNPQNPRLKSIEDAPAAPPEGQPPVCMWQAAGTQFKVQLKLARPLYPPWQPPARPKQQLADVVPPKSEPARPPPPTAADCFRAKVQEIAKQLAAEYAVADYSAAGNSSSGSTEAGLSTAERQQTLVFELNRSGRYLSMKSQLKQLLVDVVKERYKTSSKATPAQIQQLYNDLYVHLTDELQKTMVDGAVAPQQQERIGTPQPLQPGSSVNSSKNSTAATTADKLLFLAAECEAAGDVQRGHELYQRRLLLLESANAWYQYGTFCMRVKAHTRAQTALREALSINQQHRQAAAALACLGLAIATGHDVQSGPDTAALDWAEVLLHSLKEPGAMVGQRPAAVVPWALLALLYRMQGKQKEAQARSCHQEVLRQAKAAVASCPVSSATSLSGSLDEAAAAAESRPAPQPPALTGDAAAAANGYLAAAELALRFKLPGLAQQLLDLAASIKDPAGLLTKPMKLAAVAVAQQSNNTKKALQLLGEISDVIGHSAAGEDTALLQVLMGDVQYQAGNLNLAKQHYRRAMQKTPQHCPPRLYLRLGECFMASGDASIAADVYSCGLECSNSSSGSSCSSEACVEVCGDCGVVNVGGRCATTWLGLGVANHRVGEYREAELALAEANICDPEHPVVWGYLALLSLAQGREADADKTLTQAQRHKLSNAELLVELGDAYQQFGRFSTAAALLGKAVVIKDTVPVRCKLAAVLLAQHDYEGCQQQLAAGAELPATDADKQLLLSVLQKLQVAWPHL